MFGKSMRCYKKSVLVAIVLTFISAYLTLYTWRAHTIATRNIYEDPDGEAVAWTSGPSGSLFPWPREPGIFAVLSTINEVDLFIYNYLIKPWILVGLSILMWIGTGLFVCRVYQKIEGVGGQLHSHQVNIQRVRAYRNSSKIK